MANISNRSPWVIKVHGKEVFKARSKKQAQEHLDSLNNPKAILKQLETVFEVQIRLKDRDGNQINRTSSFDTYEQAEAWANEEEGRILKYKKLNGKFDIGFETMTLKKALELVLEQHYKKKSSYRDNKSRIKQIVEFFGENKLLRDVNQREIINYRDWLREKGYSASTIRNNFTFISAMYIHAKSDWLYPLDNLASGIKLDKPNNAIQRYWTDEKEQGILEDSIKKHREWIWPIYVCLRDMGFRIGELIPRVKKSPDGLKWENVDFKRRIIRLEAVKNDHTKTKAEFAGREVPISKDMMYELQKMYEIHPTKKGRVFNTSVNAVSHAFKHCVDMAHIKDMTIHSLRKISMVDLSKTYENPVLLAKISGHKSVNILNERYFKYPADRLVAMMEAAESDDVLLKGMKLLVNQLGESKAKEFIEKIREEKVVEAVTEFLK